MMEIKTAKVQRFFNDLIPSEWKIKNLDDLIKSILNGLTYDPDSTDGYPITRIETISDGSIDERKVGLTPYKSEFEKFKLKKGDILYSHINSVAHIGKTAYCFQDYEILHGMNLLRIKANEKVNSLFLFYLLNSKFGKKEAYSSAKRAVNQASLSTNEIKKFRFPLPPLPEQKAIAQVLSTADAAIHTTEKLIAQKELRKKWLMQQLLTGKKRLKGFEGEWKEHSYEKLLKVVKRNFDWDEDELYKLISVRRRSGGIFYREALYGHQILVKTLRTANEGDFLFSKMQILHGASALVTKEFDGAKISGSYIAVVPKEKKQLNMDFFQWYSQTQYFYHQTYISSYGVHIEKMTFDFETFLQLEMKLPSIEEQTAIAQVLQAADKEISLLKAKAENLREQKKGLMQQLLTGKVRLEN